MSRNRIIAIVGGVVVVIAVIAVFVTAGGGESAEPTTTTSTTAPPTTTTEKPGPVAPLTGVPIDEDEALKLLRPALVVKIDNSDKTSRPQFGLTKADVVFEPRVEGGVTRLMAVFHSQDSDPVGPVRSFRNTDVNILSALNRPLFAWHGANDIAIQALRAAEANGLVVDVGIDRNSGAFFREPSRRAPHNSMSNTSALFALAPEGSKPPPALFVYRPEGQRIFGGASVNKVHIDYGGGAGNAPIRLAVEAQPGRLAPITERHAAHRYQREPGRGAERRHPVRRLHEHRSGRHVRGDRAGGADGR